MQIDNKEWFPKLDSLQASGAINMFGIMMVAKTAGWKQVAILLVLTQFGIVTSKVIKIFYKMLNMLTYIILDLTELQVLRKTFFRQYF